MITTIAHLHAENDEMPHLGVSVDYAAKQLHRLPEIPLVDRRPYLSARCRDQRVLNLGCASGTLHADLQATATVVYGVDCEPCGHPGDTCIDLDDYPAVRAWTLPDVTVIILGELLEHLCNPGYLLRRLTAARVPLVLSTPNAFSWSGVEWLQKGYENCHGGHVAYYSYVTLTRLLQQTGWQPVAWAQYLSSWSPTTQPGFLEAALPKALEPHQPPFAEGWIVAATPV